VALPILFMNGTEDPLVPYDGGSIPTNDSVVLSTQVTVEHYEVVGGGHTEPSVAQRYGPIYKAIVGSQNGDIEMADEVWSFFEQFKAD
jgi:poly(3-hydroxybutyrate) depolymerase